MIDRGYDTNVIRAYREFVNGMTLITDEDEIETNVGVVQGGVTSPTTFGISIDPLLCILDNISMTLALADDLVAIVPG